MGFLNWLKFAFTKDGITNLSESFDADILLEVYYKELAIFSAINLISKGLANSSFKTYHKKKEIKKDNYYLFNVEPNPNQNAQEFWNQAIYQLVFENEILIIQANGYFYVADSFIKGDKVLYPNDFSQVKIGTLTMKKKYLMNEVFYTKLNYRKVSELIDGLYASYGKLLSHAMKDYSKRGGIKGQVKLSTNFSQKFEDQEKLREYIHDKFKSYFNSANAVMPVEEGFQFTESDKIKSTTNSEEINKLIDEVFSITGIAFNIPKGLLMGNLADLKSSIESFQTFCLDPISNMFEDEINRKLYGKEQYLAGTYLRIDTSSLKHIDILGSASNQEALIRNGYSPNEVRKLVKFDECDEDWANTHYITKNYSADLSKESEKEGEKP
ncbi:MAG: phage portal protein [Bacilli bacterium]|nr:phage portal protein [Bacilli bacterium]